MIQQVRGAAICFFLLAPSLVHAGIFTPLRRGFTEFRGGRIVLSEPAGKMTGLEFTDLGKDLPVEIVTGGKSKQYRVEFRAKFLRPDWSLTLNGEALRPVSAEAGGRAGDLKGAFILNSEGTATLAFAAVGARGEVEELSAHFEFYDWDLFVKERDLESRWVRQGLAWGELGAHTLTDTESAVTTFTPINLYAPYGVTEWSWWNGRHTESRAWLWTLNAGVGFALPLQGQLWAPPFSSAASVQRRNLFNAATIAGVRVPWHPGVRLRSEGFSMAAQTLSPTAPAVVTQSFVPRYTLITWLDAFLETELELSAWRLSAQVFFAHSVIGTSFRSDTSASFLPGGWSGGFKARLHLPAPRDRFFATLDFKYQSLTSGSVSVLTDLGGALGFGYAFP